LAKTFAVARCRFQKAGKEFKELVAPIGFEPMISGL
jgi:hypothetical protein